MQSSLTVVVVEDEAIVARHLVQRLTHLGCHVVGVAATGVEAVTVTASCHPDVVLMDVQLQGRMDGIEAAGVIQAHTGIPVIYVSASTDPDTLARMQASRPAGHLHKPVDTWALHQALQQALDRR
jgi:CheY-like chemotaxis protein